MTERLQPDERKEQIVAAAMKAAKKVGYKNVTREMVAAELGLTRAGISRYFTYAELLDAIVERAVAERNIKLITEALVAGHKAAKRVSKQSDIQVLITTHLFG